MKLVAIIYFITLFVFSLISFILYGVDKHIAKQGNTTKNRIKEKTLLMVTVLNGAIGSFLGRIIFHHKTEKFYFSLIIIISLLSQVAVGMLFIFKVI